MRYFSACQVRLTTPDGIKHRSSAVGTSQSKPEWFAPKRDCSFRRDKNGPLVGLRIFVGAPTHTSARSVFKKTKCASKHQGLESVGIKFAFRWPQRHTVRAIKTVKLE